jgi:hypothetical protein
MKRQKTGLWQSSDVRVGESLILKIDVTEEGPLDKSMTARDDAL